jgi:hypothetical protein
MPVRFLIQKIRQEASNELESIAQPNLQEAAG